MILALVIGEAMWAQVVHQVRPNETLGGIARKYGVSVGALQAFNGIANPNLLFVGKKLKIPSSQASEVSYVVKKGDTLNKIIKTTFNQHPLKMKVIRKVIIDNNRKAFPTGKPTSMQAGATIMIPSFGEIFGMTSQEEGISTMTKQVNPYISTDPHRGWVRFP